MGSNVPRQGPLYGILSVRPPFACFFIPRSIHVSLLRPFRRANYQRFCRFVDFRFAMLTGDCFARQFAEARVLRRVATAAGPTSRRAAMFHAHSQGA